MVLSGVERVQYGRDLMKTQDPLCQLSDCHTGAFTQLCISRRTWIVVMNAIVIPASICFTQTQIFCHLPKRIHWICFLVGISHFSPKPCSFGERNAVLGMNLDSPHWSAADDPQRISRIPGPVNTPEPVQKLAQESIPSPGPVLSYKHNREPTAEGYLPDQYIATDPA